MIILLLVFSKTFYIWYTFGVIIVGVTIVDPDSFLFFFSNKAEYDTIHLCNVL